MTGWNHHEAGGGWEHSAREDSWGDNGNGAGWDEPEDGIDPSPATWMGDWRLLAPGERWTWFQHLWDGTCMLRTRYWLPVRSGWWEDNIQVEALGALVAWVDRYDSGAWDDPPGKLALLYDLERVGALLRDGNDPFLPERDREAFARHLVRLGCQPPEGS